MAYLPLKPYLVGQFWDPTVMIVLPLSSSLILFRWCSYDRERVRKKVHDIADDAFSISLADFLKMTALVSQWRGSITGKSNSVCLSFFASVIDRLDKSLVVSGFGYGNLFSLVNDHRSFDSSQTRNQNVDVGMKYAND